MPDFSDLLLKPYSDTPTPPDSHNCYTLVVEVFRRFGIQIPNLNPAVWTQKYILKTIRNQKEIADTGNGFWKKSKDPTVPCLILMQLESKHLADHVGAYVGYGKFLHAIGSISKASIYHPLWKSAIRGYYVPRNSISAGSSSKFP